MREEKVLEFISILQENISVKKYALKFTQLAMYALTMVADPRARMSKFVSDISNLVVKECLTSMSIKEMVIYCLMIHAQQIEEEKLKERAKKSKRAMISDDDFSYSRSDGQRCLQF
ncbi:hypothetical protein MTR67_044755 [Solanum verrucosum]|uniref:Uncharacterized protein n=1 Tax=Solanum verrucosum TaxID=315347 RepID=A0AAF0URF3_SOLVR|nr:hypothetical protein MTR67_044755 [Solanum verrucosum]